MLAAKLNKAPICNKEIKVSTQKSMVQSAHSIPYSTVSGCLWCGPSFCTSCLAGCCFVLAA